MVVLAAAKISFGILIISLIISTLQLLKSNSLPDKVVALDLISMILMGITIAFIFMTGITMYLEVVLSVIVIGFLGTVIISMYLKKKSNDQ